jgi:hypothetical protein
MVKAWQRVQPGERFIIIADEVNEAMDVLQSLAETVSEEANCTGPFGPELVAVGAREGSSFSMAGNGRRNGH